MDLLSIKEKKNKKKKGITLNNRAEDYQVRIKLHLVTNKTSPGMPREYFHPYPSAEHFEKQLTSGAEHVGQGHV